MRGWALEDGWVLVGSLVLSFFPSFMHHMFSDEYAVSAEDVKMGNAFSLPPSSLVAGAEWLSMCLYRHVVNAGQE